MNDLFYNPKELDEIKSEANDFNLNINPLESQSIVDEERVLSPWKWYLSIIIVFLTIIFRLFNWQITEGKKNQALAEGNRVKLREIIAPRGNIYDQEGNLLSLNMAQSDLVVYPIELERNYQDKIIDLIKLSQIAKLDSEVIKSILSTKKLTENIVVKPKLTHDEAINFQIKISNIAGIGVENTPIRLYPSIPSLSHVLGYVSKVSQNDLNNNRDLGYSDQVGKSGLEKIYDMITKREINGIDELKIRLFEVLKAHNDKEENILYPWIDGSVSDKERSEVFKKMKNLPAEKYNKCCG